MSFVFCSFGKKKSLLKLFSTKKCTIFEITNVALSNSYFFLFLFNRLHNCSGGGDMICTKKKDIEISLSTTCIIFSKEKEIESVMRYYYCFFFYLSKVIIIVRKRFIIFTCT